MIIVIQVLVLRTVPVTVRTVPVQEKNDINQKGATQKVIVVQDSIRFRNGSQSGPPVPGTGTLSWKRR